MPLAELTPQGLVIETYEETRARIVERIRSEVSPTANTEEESYLGNLVSIFASIAREGMEALEAVYSSMDPDAATGDSLARIASITGTTPRPATHSTVICECELEPGTYPEGSLIAHVQGNPEARFESAQGVTVTGSSSVTVPLLFISQRRGPVAAYAGTLTVIASGVPGWSAVTNPQDANVGRDAETDAELRLRRLQELSGQGSTAVDAIAAAISREHAEYVQSVLVLENDTETVDANGMPPHSIEAIVLAPGIDEAALAATIFRAKAGGIRAHGALSQTYVDEQGVAHVVGYSFEDQLPLYVRMTLEVLPAQWVGIQEFARRFVEAANAYYVLGRDVKRSRLVALCHQVPGVFGVPSLELSDDGSSWDTNDRPVTYREIARFDTGRITASAVEVEE